MIELRPGFADTVGEAQQVFRAVMSALARPGTIVPLAAGLRPPAPLTPAMAAVLLTLIDFETSVWLDASLAASPAAAEFLRFHSGAKLTDDPALATFAAISDVDRMPRLASFAAGSAENPERSTTLIIDIANFASDNWRLRGPGIDGEIGFMPRPVAASFATQWRENTARYPLGVDVLFVGAAGIAGLPRTTTLLES